jgi:uncharacterized RDD family membrane protein YckC
MEEKYPLLLTRIKSLTVDSLILISCMFLFSEILGMFENVPNWVRMSLLASLLLYEPLCTTFGATIGNDKMNIRVRKNSDTTQRINLLQALVRFVLKMVFGWFSFITLFTSKKKRAIHDILTGTVMIDVS